jgi:predicted Zn-dependent protease
MGEMFKNMNDLRRLSGEAPPEFLLTHPLSSSRINDALNAAKDISNEGKKNDSLEYSLIKSRLKVQYETIPAQSIKYFNSKNSEQKTDSSIYGLSLAFSANNNFNESINLINLLLNKYPKNLFLNTSKIEILMKAKKYSQALKLANEFLKISPKNYPLTIYKSKVLLEMSRFFESEEIIRDLLIRRNEDPQLWLMLSDIQRSSKNIVGYHQSRAEYFLLLGQNEEALSQLEFALNLTKNNFQASERVMDQIISIKKEMNESRAL